LVLDLLLIGSGAAASTISTRVTSMEQTLSTKTNRRVPRVVVDLPVILFLGKKRFLCRAHQLSEFGMVVTPTLQELIGEIVQVDLFLELSKTILSLSGIVVYAIDSGFGIRFTDVPPEQQFTLKRYVEDLRERPKAG
jgi:PilZ domain-containing protein